MYIADLHIHSKYSRATSKECDLPHLDLWARYKGIEVVGTGDFTHPVWRQEMNRQLEPGEDGFYKLKPQYRLPGAVAGAERQPRFVVTGEISSIYKKNGKTRKVHNMIVLPGLEEAEALAQKLEAIGNIHSDGRPILGLDSRDLLEITLETCPEAMFIPAHIWTPHFSLFGAFSGFDTIEECFEDLTPHIAALETGLSSNPPMNWRVSALDGFTLVSNSDAHSPSKLGREANLLDTELSYTAMRKAITTGDGFRGTLEFFPEEGKYHLDGHRNCQCRLMPEETKALEGKCPVCGRKITVGVLHRVEALADRSTGFTPENPKKFESLVALPELLAASGSASAASKKNQRLYFELLEKLGPEFYILREAPLKDIRQAAGPCVAEGISRVRKGVVQRISGYDGEYGKISVFQPGELEVLSGQLSMFQASRKKSAEEESPVSVRKRKSTEERQLQNPRAGEKEKNAKEDGNEKLGLHCLQLNEQQMEAVHGEERDIAVIAGPGTGKTKTLTERIAFLIESGKAKASEITAVTFTNQAAAEMRNRLEQRLGGKRLLRGITIGTFHSVCLGLLPEKTLLGQQQQRSLVQGLLEKQGRKETPQKICRMISRVKNNVETLKDESDVRLYEAYCQALDQTHSRDLDDLLLECLGLEEKRKQFTYLLVDEYQDINPVQHQLIRQWRRDGRELFVIGDPDQCIYGFRGAESACFLRLQEELPEIRLIDLRENYRSTPEIIQCAVQLISHNAGAARKLNANCTKGLPVRRAAFENPFSEAVWIAKEIGRMTGGMDMVESQNMGNDWETLRAFSDIGVLCRTRRQLELVESCLRHESIPCIVTGREDYLYDEDVKRALCFFRFLLNPKDSLALKVCLSETWSIPGDLTIKAQELCSPMDSVDTAQLRSVLGQYQQFEGWLKAVEYYQPLLKKQKPRKLLEQWRSEHSTGKGFRRLLQAAVFHNRMESFLKLLLLGEEGDLHRTAAKNYRSGAVRLMTFHGAKGLEFPVVFAAGINKGDLPLEREKSVLNLEEERRLFFVGVTRAKEELIVTSGKEPSAFLQELGDTVQKLEVKSRKKREELQQLSLF